MIDRCEFALTVRSHELDAYAHVNNAAYQQWFEEGRDQFLGLAGQDYDWYPANLGLQFVVVRTELDFRAPAHRHEAVVVRTRLVHIGNRSAIFRQAAISSAGSPFVEARTVMAFAVGGRAAAVPDAFRSVFSAAPEGDTQI